MSSYNGLHKSIHYPLCCMNEVLQNSLKAFFHFLPHVRIEEDYALHLHTTCSKLELAHLGAAMAAGSLIGKSLHETASPAPWISCAVAVSSTALLLWLGKKPLTEVVSSQQNGPDSPWLHPLEAKISPSLPIPTYEYDAETNQLTISPHISQGTAYKIAALLFTGALSYSAGLTLQTAIGLWSKDRTLLHALPKTAMKILTCNAIAKLLHEPILRWAHKDKEILEIEEGNPFIIQINPESLQTLQENLKDYFLKFPIKTSIKYGFIGAGLVASHFHARGWATEILLGLGLLSSTHFLFETRAKINTETN